MKLTYNYINKNIEIYNEARKKLPIIKDYEEGLVDHMTVINLNLEKFVVFYNNVIKPTKESGFDLISDYSFKELKELIVSNTKSDRFKSLITNKTKPKFNKIFSDPNLFDRLLNGTWKTKPALNSRGRMSYGTRKSEKADGFKVCLVPIFNYLIQNEIEFEKLDNRYQDNYFSYVFQFFTEEVLSMNIIPIDEIIVTNTFLTSLIDKIETENINYKNLNLDYIISNIKSKLSRLMQVEPGTKLKSKNDFNSKISGSPILTKDKIYECVSSSVIRGSLSVVIIDDGGNKRTFPYNEFEDIAQRRDDLLSLLFD
jgi:hypothetical protein